MPVSKGEQEFRRQLQGWAEGYKEVMPPALYESIRDHLDRRDPQGYTLCFDSPLRAQLMEMIAQWAVRQPGDIWHAYTNGLGLAWASMEHTYH